MGNQVLSANTSVWEEDATAGATDNDKQHSVKRKVFSNIMVEGDVQLMRKKEGDVGRYKYLAGSYNCGGVWECVDSYSGNNIYKDDSYSLADGIMETPWTIVPPYSATQAPADGFQAPQKPSNQVLNLPVEVNPAGQAETPKPGVPLPMLHLRVHHCPPNKPQPSGKAKPLAPSRRWEL